MKIKMMTQAEKIKENNKRVRRLKRVNAKKLKKIGIYI
jgi:hypothetical protein